ncbi:MAG: hypothetical protein WCA46_04365 [Actinocatenispora sp.]
MTEAEHIAHERTLLLADDAEFAVLAAFADARGWTRITELPWGYQYLAKVAWSLPDDVEVLYAEAGPLGARFVSVSGPDELPVEETAATVGGLLPVISEEQLLDGLLADPRPEPVETIRALHRLNALHTVRIWHDRHPEPDERYRAMAAWQIRHPHRMVRHALLMLTSDLCRLRPEVVAPILARRDDERELADLMETYREVVKDIA